MTVISPIAWLRGWPGWAGGCVNIPYVCVGYVSGSGEILECSCDSSRWLPQRTRLMAMKVVFHGESTKA